MSEQADHTLATEERTTGAEAWERYEALQREAEQAKDAYRSLLGRMILAGAEVNRHHDSPYRIDLAMTREIWSIKL